MENKDFQKEIIAILERIDLKLANIEAGIERISKNSERTSKKNIPLDVDAMLSLPDHLRETAMAVSARGSATAEEIARDTGRTRAAESDYMNQLVQKGYLSKKRKGRTVYFSA